MASESPITPHSPSTRSFDLNSKTGKLTVSKGDSSEVISLTAAIAQRISFLFPVSSISQTWSDGNVSADYVAWFDNNFCRVVETHNMRAGKMLSKDYIQYSSIQEASEGMGFPFMCRAMGDDRGIHWQWVQQSIVAVWRLRDGTVIWFQQAWFWGKWEFCDIAEIVRAYRWEYIMCKEI